MKAETRRLLEKADRAIRAARTLLDAGDPEFASGRAYYAMFYVAEALLYERGLSFRSHGGVHAAYGREFAKTERLDPKFHRWLIDAFDIRLQTDYGFESQVGEEQVRESVERAVAFVGAARSYLEQADSGD